jgi:hypothetical protein
MRSDFDWQRLGDIPDPFAGPAGALPANERVVLAPTPPRARVRTMRATAFAAALAYEVVIVSLFKIRPDFASLPAWLLISGLAIPSAGSALALVAALRHGPSGLGESPFRLRAFTIGAPILFAAATWLALPQVHDDAFWPHAWACFLTTGILGLGPLLLGAWAFRHAFVAAAGWRAAAVGVACGAFGATALSLVCTNESATHVLVGHGPMMLVMGLLGAIAGRKIAQA